MHSYLSKLFLIFRSAFISLYAFLIFRTDTPLFFRVKNQNIRDGSLKELTKKVLNSKKNK